MPSSYSASLRLNLQATGENTNTWGNLLNTGAFALTDFAIAGWTTKALTTNYSLTSANGTTDEARSAMLKFTGTGAYTVTIPAVSKRYDVWNACTGILTVSNGSASVTVQPGEKVSVMTDGGANIARVQPTDFGSVRITSVGTPTSNSDAATKLYVDNTAFSMAAGALPGQGGNSGKLLTTDGTTASWTNAFASPTITTPTITSPTMTGATTDTLVITSGQTITGATKQTVSALGALAIDVSTGEWFTKSISTNSTFTFSGATASKAQGFVLDLTISSGATPTWPVAVKWAFGTPPTLGNGRHLLGFITDDGGTTYIGIVGAKAVA